jgi:protein O-mannosyl-transferase
MDRRSTRKARAIPAPPPRRRRYAHALVLVGLVLAAYFNALDNPFVYDDYTTVESNPSIVDPANVAWLLQYAAFRPVVNVSYAADRWLFGTSVVGYHLTSVLLHACNALLVFALVRRALTDSRLTRGVRTTPALLEQERFAAFGAAALYAVHPVMTEAVGYVSGRSELLCGLFLVAALLLARSALPPAGPHAMRPTPARWGRAAGALVCALLALLSKEVAAALPVLFVGYELLLLPSEAAVRRRRVLTVFVPGILLVGVGVAYRIRSLAGTDALWSPEPLFDLLTQTIVIWRYLGLLVWPVGQALMHDVHRVTSLWDPLALVAAAGLCALAWLGWAVRHRLPTLAFGILWFFATIAPSSSVVRLQEAMAEHRVYIAGIGVFLIAGMALGRLSWRWVLVGGHVRLRVAAALVVAVLVLAGLTVRRNVVWASPIALWEEAKAAAPTQWQPRYALGDALREAGRCEDAVGEYEGALAIHQPNPRVRLNLGICLAQLGRLDEAEATFRRLIAAAPEFARGYTNLAGVAQLRGQEAEARDLYARAIEVDPRNLHARLQLAFLDEQAGHLAEALRYCEEAQRIDPLWPAASDCVARLRSRQPQPPTGP